MPKKSTAPLTVTPLTGEYLRFLVKSRSKANLEYLVDLEENNWNGACGCIHFEMRCAPHLSRGAQPADAFRCAHIRRARSYFLDEILPKLGKELSRKNQKFLPIPLRLPYKGSAD